MSTAEIYQIFFVYPLIVLSLENLLERTTFNLYIFVMSIKNKKPVIY
jgi:hypothetical protein